jgi:hypothetical protein
VSAVPPVGHAVTRPLTSGERAAVKATATLTAVLGLLGFAVSYASVARAAAPSFGRWAPAVPVGTDLAIAVFSAADMVLARLDMRVRWVRLLPWCLTAATVYLNVSGQATLFGRVAHAVFPSLWVVAVALAAHVIRVRAHLATGKAMDRVPVSRWLLSPVSTARLKRRMILWEIRSYPVALERERERVLALTALQDEYGAIAWRWRAPRRERALFRLGLHAPSPAAVPVAAVKPPAQPGPARSGTPPARPRAPRKPPAGARPAGGLTPEAVADHFADQIASGRIPSGKQIRAQWGTGSDTAGKLHDAVEVLVRNREAATAAPQDRPVPA